MNIIENKAYETEQLPYLLFAVGGSVYAISCDFVCSIETLGEITKISETDPNVRGGVIYQNNFISLLDMRKLFGLDSQLEEFEKTVQPNQRIRDHENWMEALERSVRDRTEFTLTDDPHLCEFGKWYYSFHSNNNVLMHQLKAIDAPHEAVHNTAKLVRELMKNNEYEKAKQAIAELKATHYKTTLHLLSTLGRVVAESIKELYIVVNTSEGTKGIIVDAIVGVEYLGSSLDMPDSRPRPVYLESLRQRKNDSRVIIVLNDCL